MNDDLKRKKEEANAAWRKYLSVAKRADENRENVRGARTAIFESLSSDSPITSYLVTRLAEEAQAELNEEETRLGKLFDKSSDQVDALRRSIEKSGKSGSTQL
jgi:hypothetical protein